MLRRPLTRAAAGLVLTVAVLGGVEAALRLWVPEDALLFVHEERRPPLVIPPPPRPGEVQTLHDGPYTWTLQHSAGALRERHAPPPTPADGEVRLLAVGDSWVWGFGVDQDRVLPVVLEELLSGVLAPRVEVVNAGVPGGSDRALLDRAHALLEELPDIRGVLLAQPHNPRRLLGPGERPAPAAGPSPWWTYRWLRTTLLPHLDPVPPRALHGEALAHATADWRAFALAQRAAGREVWFLALPQDRESAVDRRYPPEAEWLAAMEGFPVTGHALAERSCWSFTDPFHPSEAGQRALAERVAPMIRGEPPAPPWSDSPRCVDVPGAGPGKPGWEWTDPPSGLPSRPEPP